MARQSNRKGPHQAQFSAGGRKAARSGGPPLPPDMGNDAAKKGDVTHGRAVTLAGVARDARLDEKYMLLVVLSAAIATLGLLQSSSAVVIGAMLVSPLLGPIMGMGFGLATLDSQLIKRSLVTLSTGMIIAIIVAVIVVWLSPMQDVTPEIRARTQPNLLDLGVAVVGGFAGVYAIMRNLSGVMVGVAIATALVPPLSTVGFGLATGRLDFALGASLLFLTNTLAIAFAATVVARINKFGPSLTPQHTAMQVAGIVVTLGILSVPLGLSLNNIVREVSARSTVQSILDDQLDEPDKIDSLSVRIEDETVIVDGVVLVDNYEANLTQQLSERAGKLLDRKVDVNIVQLRQQTNATEQVTDGFNRRLTEIERRDQETEALVKDLMVGGLIDRDAIVVDSQAKLVMVQRDGENEGREVSEAIDRIVAAAQANHPAWLLRNVAVERTAP